MHTTRQIGPIGTVARVAVGGALVASAFVIGDVRWSEAMLGLVIFPVVQVLIHHRWRSASAAQLHATGPRGYLVNCVLLVLLLIVPATTDATLLWLAASLLLGAWQGYAGCESLAISNWLLRRQDRVGCLVFGPIDALESRAMRIVAN
jgi:phosphatidylserine synthase